MKQRTKHLKRGKGATKGRKRKLPKVHAISSEDVFIMKHRNPPFYARPSPT